MSKVIKVDCRKKTLYFTMDARTSIGGNAILFHGGESGVQQVECDDEKHAQEEFRDLVLDLAKHQMLLERTK